jgi:anti-sigma factor RsiW
MVQIIRLHGDPHKQAQTLLAWYANGSLDPDEAAAVEAHLAECSECRADLKLEHRLGAHIADLPFDADSGWAALRARVESRAAQRPSLREPGTVRLLRRRVPLAWAVAAQAASIAVMFGLGVLAVSQPGRPLYRALGSTPAPAAGNVVVVFKPSTSELELRGLLARSGARLVDGPTASDAYVLHVAAARRNDALAGLRADSHVVLAEPIDGTAGP